MAFLLNSQAQGVSGKNEQSTQTPWRGRQRRGAQCSCIGFKAGPAHDEGWRILSAVFFVAVAQYAKFSLQKF